MRLRPRGQPGKPDTLLTLAEISEAWRLPSDLVMREITAYVDPKADLTFYSAREVSEKFGSPEQVRAARGMIGNRSNASALIVQPRRSRPRPVRPARRLCLIGARAWRWLT